MQLLYIVFETKSKCHATCVYQLTMLCNFTLIFATCVYQLIMLCNFTFIFAVQILCINLTMQCVNVSHAIFQLSQLTVKFSFIFGDFFVQMIWIQFQLTVNSVISSNYWLPFFLFPPLIFTLCYHERLARGTYRECCSASLVFANTQVLHSKSFSPLTYGGEWKYFRLLPVHTL